MINPTPLNATELDGVFFEHDLFWEICTSLGVHRTISYGVTNIVVNQENVSLVLEGVSEKTEIWSAKSIIFAPNFNHPKEQPEYICIF